MRGFSSCIPKLLLVLVLATTAQAGVVYTFDFGSTSLSQATYVTFTVPNILQPGDTTAVVPDSVGPDPVPGFGYLDTLRFDSQLWWLDYGPQVGTQTLLLTFLTASPANGPGVYSGVLTVNLYDFNPNNPPILTATGTGELTVSPEPDSVVLVIAGFAAMVARFTARKSAANRQNGKEEKHKV
jgi:hypothetical protein